MTEIHDGPESPFFSVLPVKGNANLAELAGAASGEPSGVSGMSDEMSAALKDAPSGYCVCWGIPFEIDDVVVLSDAPVSIEINPVKARWLIFMHTSDIRPLQPGAGGIISPVRGHGMLAEHAADYVICYEDGSQARAAIRRRHQLGAFHSLWGENCFESVAHHKPYPVHAAHEQLGPYWGVTQMRNFAGDKGGWDNWLWAWENPYPEKAIAGFRFEPVSGVVMLSAISAGKTNMLPLRWQTRHKACLALPVGEAFQPGLDKDGLLEQIQLDLGQVISATPRLVYPNDGWPVSYHNQLPVLADNEILVEYTAHPEACFHLFGANESRVIPLSEVEKAGAGDRLRPVAPAQQAVTLRIVERGHRKPVPVKLHIHGESGEYLAPVDRHRILNPAFFEDYSVDFAHIQDWSGLPRLHAGTYIPGETLVKLPLGKVYIEVSKGFEVRPVRSVVEVTAETHEIVIEIEKVLPWRVRGWVTADTHVHFLSPISAMLEGSAEGVNVINLLASQWGELMTNVGDFDGHNTWGSKEAGGDGEYLVRVGTENRQHVLGHISLLGYRGRIIAPMTTGGPDESALGDPIEMLLTEWARQCHRQGGLVVLPHFPNPRAEGAASIILGEIDAVEMTSWEDHYSGIDPYSLSDWYRYLNCGYLVPAVGGTDKMAAVTAVGTVRTYAHLDPQTEFSYETWKETVRRGETFVTYGPLLDFQVAGRPMGSRLNLSAGGGTLDVTWQVASVTIPISRVELVVNGEIRESQATPPEGSHGHWSVRVEKSCWLALLVRGQFPSTLRLSPEPIEGHPEPVGGQSKDEIIAAHSSPVMVMVEGSPILAAADAVTILDQIEGTLVYLDTVGTRAEDRTYKRMRLALESAHRTLHNRMHQQGHYHEHI
jgi:hypothetical protein